jgi:MFS transporter, PHS family, inorganic phosphate transporter
MPVSTAFSRLKLLIVAGVGLYIDGYLNICIGLVVPIIGYLYYSDTKASIPTFSGDLIKAGMAIGMVCGQLLFGFFGDALGRHRVYGKELMLTIFGTMLLILMPWGHFSHDSVVAWLTVFRIVTGFGTGGGELRIFQLKEVTNSPQTTQ